jgi:hypothetical protein
VREDGAWFYYRCSHRWQNGSDACPLGKGFNVNKVEPLVRRYVSTLLQDPSKVHGGLEVLTDREREGTRRDADREAKAWLDRLAEADTMRRGFQEQAAKGLMTLDELENRLKEIEETHETTRAELAILEERRQRLEELEHDRDALMERYAGAVPEALENLLPEERHRVYRMLRLRVLAYPDSRLEANGVLGSAQDVCRAGQPKDTVCCAQGSIFPGDVVEGGKRRYQPLTTVPEHSYNFRNARYAASGTAAGAVPIEEGGCVPSVPTCRPSYHLGRHPGHLIAASS